VLETWWCDYDVNLQTWTNCCADDSPTISGMMTLFEKLRALPAGLTTPAQRAAWDDFATRRMPALPTTGGPAPVIAPARVLSSGTHNSEGPELYAMHPHRVFTKGRAVATGADISLGVRTHDGSAWAKGSNEGWAYALNSAALLGLTTTAATQVRRGQQARLLWAARSGPHLGIFLPPSSVPKNPAGPRACQIPPRTGISLARLRFSLPGLRSVR